MMLTDTNVVDASFSILKKNQINHHLHGAELVMLQIYANSCASIIIYYKHH